MNTSYVYQSAQVGEFRNAVLTGSGPKSYSRTTGDVVYNPGANEYINACPVAVDQTGAYVLLPRPTTAGNIRAGAPSPSQSGWTFHWYTVSTSGIAAEVTDATDLSAKVVQFGALISQL